MKKNAGQTLIEVLIGLSASAVVMAAIATATLSALSNSDYTRNQNLATNYAQQGMEIVKNLQSIDYGTFSSLNGVYCFADTCNEIDGDPTHTGQSCAKISGSRCPGILNVHGSFIRTVEVHAGDSEAATCNETGSTDNIKINVIVAWNDQKCTDRTNLYCHNVTISSCFNNAQIVPTP
jgi:Tfp pilus assembly protein PilV